MENTKIDSEDIVKQVEEDNRFAAFFVDSAFAIDTTHGEFGDLAKKQVIFIVFLMEIFICQKNRSIAKWNDVKMKTKKDLRKLK